MQDLDPNVFRAIADPTRRSILVLLRAGELSTGEVAARFAMTRPAVAKHLRILADTDLTRVEPRGRRRIHRLNPEPLRQVAQWLSFFDRFWDERLAQLKHIAENQS